jgi:hypothetical protein
MVDKNGKTQKCTIVIEGTHGGSTLDFKIEFAPPLDMNDESNNHKDVVYAFQLFMESIEKMKKVE